MNESKEMAVSKEPSSEIRGVENSGSHASSSPPLGENSGDCESQVWSTVSSIVNPGFSLVNNIRDRVSRDIINNDNPVSSHIIAYNLLRTLYPFGKSFITMILSDDQRGPYRAPELENSTAGLVFNVMRDIFHSRVSARDESLVTNTDTDRRRLLSALVITGFIKQIKDLPIELESAFSLNFCEPARIHNRKKDFQHNIRVMKQIIDSVLTHSHDRIFVEQGKRFNQDVEAMLLGPCADGVERLGHLRILMKSGVSGVSNFLSLRNMQNWLIYLERYSAPYPKTMLHKLATYPLLGASEVYKFSCALNIFTALRKAPELLSSALNVIKFIRNPEEAQIDYLRDLVQRIAVLIPKTAPWDASGYEMRHKIFMTIKKLLDEGELTNAIWRKFYDDVLSQTDKLANQFGAGVGAVLIDLVYIQLMALDGWVKDGAISRLFSMEAGFNQCMLDTFGYYALKTGCGKVGGFIVGHSLKGACNKLLLAQRDSVTKKTKKVIEEFLLHQLFNPGEIERARLSEARGIGVIPEKGIEWVINTLSKKVLTSETSVDSHGLTNKMGRTIENFAAYSPKASIFALIALPSCFLAYQVKNMALAAGNKIKENSGAIDLACSAAAGAAIAYTCSSSFRTRVDNIAKPVGQAVKDLGKVALTVLRSPNLIAAVGLCVSHLTGETSYAVGFGLPLLSSFVNSIVYGSDNAASIPRSIPRV